MKQNKAVKKAEKKAAALVAITDSINNGSQFVSLNKSGRAAIEEQFRIGANSFNTYVGRDNINVEMLALAQANADMFRTAMVNAPSELAFYYVSGDGGTHGGKAELFTFENEGKTIRALRHPYSGAFVLDGMVKGLQIVTEAQLITLAAKANDLRQFSVKWFDADSAKSAGVKIAKGETESVFAGAVIGSMSEKRQVLVYNNGDGLSAVCLTTGKIGKTEKADRAVEIGQLTDADRATIRKTLFEGILSERGKHAARNTSRAKRKAELAHARNTVETVRKAAGSH